MQESKMITNGGIINLRCFATEIEAVLERAAAAQKSLKTLQDDARIDTVPSSTFFAMCSVLNAQRKAPLIERFVYSRLSLEKISASENCGDAVNRSSNTKYELKISTTNYSECINVRQIRLWQDVDYYLVAYIDELDVSSSYVFLLTHAEMEKEVNDHGSATHGTASANKRNDNIEYSLTIKIGSQMFHEWLTKYASDIIKKKLFDDIKDGALDGKQE